MMRAAVTLYDALLGGALLFVPWTRLWQENWVLWQSGSLQSFLLSGAARGAISGLGAAFLILAAARMAGIELVDGDDDGPPRPGSDAVTAPARHESAELEAPAGIRER